MKNLAHMTPDELVHELVKARTDLDKGARRLHEIARILQANVRRESADELTTAYLGTVSSCIQLSGLVDQGLRRSASAMHLVERRRAVVAEEKERDAAVAKRAQERKERLERRSREVGTPTMDDFVSLYGAGISDGI